MQVRQRYLIFGIAMTLTPISVISASPASADCTNAGYATVCAQGTVRGGGPTPPSVSYPSYSADRNRLAVYEDRIFQDADMAHRLAVQVQNEMQIFRSPA